jgi:hypothetical protein
MVRSCFAKVDSPLTGCDYHAVANEERQIIGEKIRTKVALYRPAPRGVVALPERAHPMPVFIVAQL